MSEVLQTKPQSLVQWIHKQKPRESAHSAMCFPLPCFPAELPVPKPLLLVIRVVDLIRLMLIHLGLCSSSPVSSSAPRGNSTTMVRLSPPMDPLAVKSQLPVVEYGSFEEGSCHAACAACLEGLEQRDEVRELGNCSHVFHKRCIDRWVDVGAAHLPPVQSAAASCWRRNAGEEAEDHCRKALVGR